MILENQFLFSDTNKSALIHYPIVGTDIRLHYSKNGFDIKCVKVQH